MPHLNLPAQDKDQLARAPLDLVVCQLRFQARELRADKVFSIYGGLKDRLPTLLPLERQTAEVTVGPQPGFSTQKDAGWTISSSDGSWTATLMPDSLSLQTTQHTTWTGAFEPLLERLVNALAEHIQPEVELRVGVRYVDRLSDVGGQELSAWKGRVRDDILGIVLHPVLGPAITSEVQQIELEVADHRGCTLKHGAFRDPARDAAATYFVDTDTYHLEARPFDPQQTIRTARELHEIAVGIFQQVITSGYLAALKETS